MLEVSTDERYRVMVAYGKQTIPYITPMGTRAPVIRIVVSPAELLRKPDSIQNPDAPQAETTIHIDIPVKLIHAPVRAVIKHRPGSGLERLHLPNISDGGFNGRRKTPKVPADAFPLQLGPAGMIEESIRVALEEKRHGNDVVVDLKHISANAPEEMRVEFSSVMAAVNLALDRTGIDSEVGRGKILFNSWIDLHPDFEHVDRNSGIVVVTSDAPDISMTNRTVGTILHSHSQGQRLAGELDGPRQLSTAEIHLCAHRLGLSTSRPAPSDGGRGAA